MYTSCTYITIIKKKYEHYNDYSDKNYYIYLQNDEYIYIKLFWWKLLYKHSCIFIGQ